MELDSTVSLSIADENVCFHEGGNVTELDKLSGPGVERISDREVSIIRKLPEDPTSWGYLFIHNKKVESFEAKVNKQQCYKCFVHKTAVYKKVAHGVKKVQKPSVSGYVFLQGKTKDLQKYLKQNFPSLHLVKDHCTGYPAVIPDCQMQPFMQIMKVDPTRIRILQKPIEYYSNGNVKLRVLTGVLKGQEGYLIRIDHDRKLVMQVGDIAVAIGGVCKQQLEQVQMLLDSRQAKHNG